MADSQRAPEARPKGFAFAQIAEALRADIVAGTYRVGDSLPSERLLSERFGVSPGTVRVALSELVNEGIVDGTRGRPKQVVRTPQPRASFSEFHSFAQWAWSAGHEPGGTVICMQWEIAGELDEELLEVPAGRRLLAVTRRRTLDGETVMLEQTRYPEWLGEIIETIPADARSVTRVLAEEHEVRFSHAEHRFGAEAASAEAAALLDVDPGTALLVHRRVTRDPFGRRLEWSTDRYIAGKIMVSVGSSWHSNPLQWTLPEAD
ncbi:GntR family transcriptional regulator [Brevibacterium luteolum]|nr:GntR family transcriptional regulator [Brevibacterium luteolum]